MSRDTSTDSTAAAAAGSVDLLVRGAVAVLTLNRPDKLNALTGAMAAQLAAAVGRINDDRDLRAAVIVGAGRAFCVGSDIGELDTYDGPWDFGRVGVRVPASGDRQRGLGDAQCRAGGGQPPDARRSGARGALRRTGGDRQSEWRIPPPRSVPLFRA